MGVSKNYKVQDILYREGIATSRMEVKKLTKGYNNFKLPISKALEDILSNPEPFVEYVRSLEQIKE